MSIHVRQRSRLHRDDDGCRGSAEPAVLRGKDAFGSWQADAPGTRRLIRPTICRGRRLASAANVSRVVARPAGTPQGPGRIQDRAVRRRLVGPAHHPGRAEWRHLCRGNAVGRIRVLVRARDSTKPPRMRFMPPGSIIRSASPSFRMATIRNGSMSPIPMASCAFPIARRHQGVRSARARGRSAARLGHSTRDIVFTPRTTAACWCRSARSAMTARAWASRRTRSSQTHPLGAAWGEETDRAAVLAFDPYGKNEKLYATGIRNCVGLAIQPGDRFPVLDQ